MLYYTMLCYYDLVSGSRHSVALTTKHAISSRFVPRRDGGVSGGGGGVRLALALVFVLMVQQGAQTHTASWDQLCFPAAFCGSNSKSLVGGSRGAARPRPPAPAADGTAG